MLLRIQPLGLVLNAIFPSILPSRGDLKDAPGRSLPLLEGSFVFALAPLPYPRALLPANYS